jgi:hypothetical protein
MAQVNARETPLDTKCGLIHNISSGQFADSLYDVKLTLSAFDARERIINLQSADNILTKNSVERAQFRLWAGAKSVSSRPL